MRSLQGTSSISVASTPPYTVSSALTSLLNCHVLRILQAAISVATPADIAIQQCIKQTEHLPLTTSVIPFPLSRISCPSRSKTFRVGPAGSHLMCGIWVCLAEDWSHCPGCCSLQNLLLLSEQETWNHLLMKPVPLEKICPCVPIHPLFVTLFLMLPLPKTALGMSICSWKRYGLTWAVGSIGFCCCCCRSQLRPQSLLKGGYGFALNYI